MVNWIKTIPASTSHGSGILQKKLWHLVSDYTRIRDFYKYGTCVATGKQVYWKDGDAGHFIPYSLCNGIFKFSEENVFLQSKRSNGFGGASEGYEFAKELERRGISVDGLYKKNASYHPPRLTTLMVLEKMEDILDKMADLPEKPDYYERVYNLRSKEKSVV